MPNRIIKETIHTSDDVAKMSDFEFRVWVSLITYVDDYGRGDARAAIIKGACFPLIERITPKLIEKAIDGLVRIGCVKRYVVDGKPYLYLPAWEKHQRVRSSIEKYPAPPEEDETDPEEGDPEQSAASCGELRRVAASCGELRQDAARARVESESESNPNPNPEDREARARTRTHTRESERFAPPTLEEVTEYCRSRNSPVDSKKFYEYFDAGNWKDAKGQPVKNWKQKILTWEKYDTPKEKEPTVSSFETDDFFGKAVAASYRGDPMLTALKEKYGEAGA